MRDKTATRIVGTFRSAKPHWHHFATNDIDLWPEKGFPYSLLSVGPGADPGVQAVSLQVTISHPPGGGLPLLSVRFAVTFPAAEHHCPLASTKLYWLVTETHRCEQLAQSCCYAVFAPSSIWTQRGFHFPRFMVEHFYVKSGDPSYSGFRDIVQKKCRQTDRCTDRQTPLKSLPRQLPLAWLLNMWHT